MKKVEILSISVVAAAVLMTGCGSSSDSTPVGPAAPVELSTPIEMNATSAKNAMAYLIYNAGSPAAQRTAHKSAVAAAMERTPMHQAPGGSDAGTYSYDCSISGTWGYSYTSSYTGEPYSSTGDSWSTTYSESGSYNNCVDNYSSTINGEPVNRIVWNGTWSNTYSDAYDSDTNMTKDSYSGQDAYYYSYENNETLTSRVYTYNESWSGADTTQGNNSWSGLSDATYSYTWSDNGYYSRVDTNSTGSVVTGYKYVYGNESGSGEGVQDYSKYKFTNDGFYTRYDINATGDEVYSYGNYFKNFTFAYSEAGNESNITVNGTAGTDCLGGSVTFTTTTGIQQNQADYFDGDDSTGGNVLPYMGGLTMTGSGSATVAFTSNDTNHTSALLSTADGDENLTRVSDLAIGLCD